MTQVETGMGLSFINRLTGVYFSPGETFVDVGREAGLLPPLLLLLVLTVGSTAFTINRLPTERLMTERIDQMVEEGKLSPEQAVQQREQMAKFAPYTRIIAPITAGLFVLVFPLILAGIARLVTMMMGLENRFLSLWSVAVYSILAVSILSIALFTVIVFIKPSEEIDLQNPVGSNLAAILSLIGVTGLPKFAVTLLTYADIFYVWKIILLGIGFAAVTPRLKASTSLAICGVFGLLLAVVAAAWGAIFG
jgi:hypothetical protein